MTGAARPESHAPGYFDLRRDLEQPGCAVCRGASRSAWRLVDGLLWEGVTDPLTRTRLRRSRGFCREHSLMAIRVADAENGQLGMAIVYEDLLAQLEAALGQEPAKPRWGGVARRSVPAPDLPCPACVSALGTEENYLRLLGRADPTSELGTLARSGAGTLCLRHLRLGLATTDPDEQRRLVQIALTGIAAMRGDLQEFIRKRDYRFSHEPLSAEEGDAWRRAVRFLEGEPVRRPDP
ncbi:MAG: hypothetical protein ACM3OO_06100 [Planctomycetaceae bacterium]